jgi:tetratricopeptide (TPR) repeat protein
MRTSVKARPTRPRPTKPGTRPEIIIPAPARPIPRGWIWAAGSAAALLAAVIAYWPALQGGFLFDDVHMQFATPHPDQLPLAGWITGARPLTDFSYWVNYQLGGTDPLGYHLTNILLHVVASLMVFLIVRKVLELASIDLRRRTVTAGFCGAIFLLHPVQTEAVAYISQRSENLSVALAFAAWACFLYRPSNAIGMRTVLLVILLFGAAVTGKEHVAVLPLVLLLTDYYWNPGFSFQGVRRNWRLYAPLAVTGVLVAAFLYSYLANEPTIGFHMKGVTPYQYLYTQCRVVFIYLRLFLLPFGQNADYAIGLSHTPLEHGAVFGMLALAAAAVAAFLWRKRFPIASYGFFVALVFFLPTSSIMPVRDLAAERRLYLPMIGFLLMTSEVLVRVRWTDRRLAVALAGIVMIAGALTWNRSQVWSSSLALWSDTVEKSPQKPRGHHGLAAAEFGARRYADAVRQYELANGPEFSKDGAFYANWAFALKQVGRLDDAIQMGRKAVQLSPDAPTYRVLGELVALNGDAPQALELLDKGEKSDPTYVPIHLARGNILLAMDRNAEACAAYERARSLDPQNPSAAKGLAACAGSPLPGQAAGPLPGQPLGQPLGQASEQAPGRPLGQPRPPGQAPGQPPRTPPPDTPPGHH